MMFFGQTGYFLDPRAALSEVAGRWQRAAGRPERLLDVLLQLGEVVQAVLDHDLKRVGEEGPSSVRGSLHRALHEAAVEYVSTLRRRPPRSRGAESLTALADAALPERVEAKLVEGFSHYSVLPELYARLALELGADSACVLGIRSAGVVLGAVVAASVGAPPARSVRPEGHPFNRTVRASFALRRELAQDAARQWLIVDEGPGLSGSSFLAAAALLEDAGVERARVRLMPSHDGMPGAAASDESRRRFASYARSSIDFERAYAVGTLPFRKQRASSLRWPDGAFMDLSAGRWRHLCFDSPSDFPPAQRTLERRKYWFSEDGRQKLAKFAGLGATGARKLRRGRLLSARGFIPPVDGIRAGFLIGEWLDARPADVRGKDRDECLDFLRGYLRYLSRLPAEQPDRGATSLSLLAMAEHNVAECLGTESAARVSGFRDVATRFEAATPVYTDGKLEPWEFLISKGRLIKTDALDHAAGCDLVRAQPIVWDVAGAGIELGLSAAERQTLREATESPGQPRLDDRAHAFYRVSYLAFRIGTIDVASLREFEPVELGRLATRRRHYLELLKAELRDAG